MKESIITKSLTLQIPRIDDLSALKAFEKRNKAHLEKWESIAHLPTDEEYRNRLIKWRKECEDEEICSLFHF